MDDIDKLLSRGVDTIYPSKKALEKVLRSGKKLKLYQGFDPTGSQLHIGHAVGFRKLRQFQDLGHEVIFLIGDGTGQAGDPSGKRSAREKFFTREELRQNGKEYVMQASKIVRFDGDNPVKILYNGDWLNELTLVDILSIAQNFSVQQLIERDMYQDRIRRGESINLREFLYPLLQGYDSVAMDVDMEVGGTDQTFNMLAGRTLVKNLLNKEKFVLTLPLLADSKGVKIGKSEGNVIGLTDPPNDLYAKIMSLSDDAIIPCFTLLTDKPRDGITKIESSIDEGANPMEFKKRLAWGLTAWLNSEKNADVAQRNFEGTVQRKDVSVSIPVLKLKAATSTSTVLSEVLVHNGLVQSKSEAKRLIKQNAIDINDTTQHEDGVVDLAAGDILKVGKKKIVKIT